MIINHNMAAMNTHRQLGSNNAAAANNIEKLSSGLKINKAGDDAAGLAISEKMRGQIRGLDMAAKNSQDGISMIQTAEGSLNETHDILQRMRELAVQAGNDTNVDGDRKEIQKELNQLTSEINRIGNTTEFNTKKLLNGGKEDVAVKANVVGNAASTTGGTPEALGKYSVTIDAAAVTDTEKVTIGGKDFTKADGGGTASAGTFANNTELIAAINDGTSGLTGYTATAGATNEIILTQVAGSGSATPPTAADDGGVPITVTEIDAGAAEVPGTSVAEKAGVSEFNIDITKLKDGQKVSIGEENFEFKKDGTGDFKDLTELKAKIDAGGNYTAAIEAGTGKVTLTQAAGEESAETPKVSINTGEDFSASLQIGANENQSMTININDMRASALGLTGIGAGFTSTADVSNGTDSTGIESGLDVSSAKNAAAAITEIQSAIDKVSAERSKLGANQNRLEHTINNLGTSSENLTAAESRVRDVDMAKEMMDFTKNNILTQAAQAMLSQANQQPQGVLQLLR